MNLDKELLAIFVLGLFTTFILAIMFADYLAAERVNSINEEYSDKLAEIDALNDEFENKFEESVDDTELVLKELRLAKEELAKQMAEQEKSGNTTSPQFVPTVQGYTAQEVNDLMLSVTEALTEQNRDNYNDWKDQMEDLLDAARDISKNSKASPIIVYADVVYS